MFFLFFLINIEFSDVRLDHNSPEEHPGNELRAAFNCRVSRRPLSPVISVLYGEQKSLASLYFLRMMINKVVLNLGLLSEVMVKLCCV